MGYVTHTKTESVGEVCSTTSIHFESFENFLQWESRKDFVNEEVKLKLHEKSEVNEPKWILHDGSDWCPVPFGCDCEVMFMNGYTERDMYPEDWRWRRLDPFRGDDIVKYRVWNK